MKHINDYIAYLKEEKRYSPHSFIAYEGDIFAFLESCGGGDDVVSSLTIVNIRAWIASMLSSNILASSVRRKISSLKGFCRYLIKIEAMKNNPFDTIIVPKMGKRLPEFLDEDVLNDFFDSKIDDAADFTEVRDCLILLMAYSTGMRRSEIVALRVEDVDISSRLLRIVGGKGGKDRLVPIVDELLELVQNYLRFRGKYVCGSHSYFFITNKGHKIYDKFVYRVSVKYLSEVTTMKNKGPHILRHSFATSLLNNGAKIEVIRKLLGHSSISATQIYAHTSFENLKKVFNQAHPRA